MSGNGGSGSPVLALCNCDRCCSVFGSLRHRPLSTKSWPAPPGQRVGAPPRTPPIRGPRAAVSPQRAPQPPAASGGIGAATRNAWRPVSLEPTQGRRRSHAEPAPPSIGSQIGPSSACFLLRSSSFAQRLVRSIASHHVKGGQHFLQPLLVDPELSAQSSTQGAISLWRFPSSPSLRHQRAGVRPLQAFLWPGAHRHLPL